MSTLTTRKTPITNNPRWIQGRTLVIDDHENLVGGPKGLDDDSDIRDAADIWRVLVHACSLTDQDQVIIGLSGYSAKKWMTSLPFNRVQLVIGNGPDGADQALLDAIDVNHIARRFDSVVIASGDHIFADAATALRHAGLRVYNVTSSRSRASKVLADACGIHARLKVGAPVTQKWAMAA